MAPHDRTFQGIVEIPTPAAGDLDQPSGRRDNCIMATTITTDRIQKRSDVCGGSACILGHRIPVWGLVQLRRLGASDTHILEAYPTLSSADLEAAWEYAAANTAEIDRDIRDNEAGDEGFVE
jgi:uncharacterized protein (DUF433 family)